MNTRRLTRSLLLGGAMLATAAVSGAQASPAAPQDAKGQPLARVEAAWVRSAVAGQQGTGAFMKITAPRSMQLVGASTPAAAVAELHQMKMEGDVMRMRAVPALELPAGRTVELKPGGYHLMLMDLKQPLAVGSTVPLTLRLRDANGVEHQMELKLPVAIQAPASPARGASAAHTQ